MMTEGTIGLYLTDGDITSGTPGLLITPAVARPAPVRADREMHRPPYGTAWFVDGDAERGVELLDLTIEVHATEALGIAGASLAANNTVITLATATLLIEVPFGYFTPRGVTEWSRSPIEGGYRLQIQLATDGWQAAP